MSSCRHRGLPAPIDSVPQLRTHPRRFRNGECVTFTCSTRTAPRALDQRHTKLTIRNAFVRVVRPACLRLQVRNHVSGCLGHLHATSRTGSPSPHRGLCQQVHSFLRARPPRARLALRLADLDRHDTSDRLLPSHHFKTSTRHSRVPAASADSRRIAPRGNERFTTPESLRRSCHESFWSVVFSRRSSMTTSDISSPSTDAFDAAYARTHTRSIAKFVSVRAP